MSKVSSFYSKNKSFFFQFFKIYFLFETKTTISCFRGRRYDMHSIPFWNNILKLLFLKVIAKRLIESDDTVFYGIFLKLQWKKRTCLLIYNNCVNQKTITLTFHQKEPYHIQKLIQWKLFLGWIWFSFYAFFLLKTDTCLVLM